MKNIIKISKSKSKTQSTKSNHYFKVCTVHADNKTFGDFIYACRYKYIKRHKTWTITQESISYMFDILECELTVTCCAEDESIFTRTKETQWQ